MVSKRDWLPGPRADQILMAKDWLLLLNRPTPPWGIPSAEVSDLGDLMELLKNHGQIQLS
ncbi:MAG: hypothetical protein LBF88_10435 [Planctomycetaceae bacterium]|nr:hypothetical protein [Planctomycetaceae bacterium]